MSATRVLVTGGSGFIGSRLCERLASLGRQVTVLDLVPPSHGGTSHILADVRDADAMLRALASVRPHAVVHLAAVHFVPACEADPDACRSVNVGGTRALLEACAGSREVGIVVLASTGAVYAPDERAHTEESPLGPIERYGSSKLEAERLVESFHGETRVAVAIARLFNAYGPRETNPHLIPALLTQALAGPELLLGDLTTRRDYVYVDDAARALAALLHATPRHGRLTCNVGSGRAVAGTELVELTSRLLRRRLEVRSDPARLRAIDRPVLVSDCSRARALLGWRPQTGLEEGLRAALQEPVASAAVAQPG